MITLHTFGPGMGLADPSPFVMKAMMLLKLAALDYREEPADVRKAPKMKLPVIVDESVKIPDSTFIRFHIETKYGFDFDAGLSAEEKAIAWAAEKMMEDHFYWAIVHNRWMVDENFNKGPAMFFASIPALLRPFIISMIRKKLRNNLFGQGMGRHSEAEITRLACRDIDSLADILGNKPYLMGEKPCGADATFFAFMWSGLCPVFDSDVRRHTECKTNITAYVERMKLQYMTGQS